MVCCLDSLPIATTMSSLASDLDPDPVGSAFIWVCGSGSRGIKLREKAEFNQQIF